MYTIGDFLIRIKNAYQARKTQIEYPHSNVVEKLAQILASEGYIKNSKIKTQKSKSGTERKFLEIELKYDGRVPALTEVKLISKPSVHNYINKINLRKISRRYGIGILSTSRGMMTTREAQKQGVGGEIICQVS